MHEKLRVAFLGFGNVNRALHTLLARRRGALAAEYEIEYVVTGLASRTAGWIANDAGLDPQASAGERCADIEAWLYKSRPDVVFEAIPLEPHSGQPALDYLRTSIAHGAHAISANKGPLVHGYRELRELARQRGVHYRFES